MISELLIQLRKDLFNHTPKDGGEFTPNCLSIYRCHKVQQLNTVPFYQPTLLMVVDGHKEVMIGDLNFSVQPGELLLIPADTTLWMGNCPDKKDRTYLGLAFRFDQEALNHFRLVYGSDQQSWDLSANWHVKAPDSILTALRQWLSWNDSLSISRQFIQHRQVELLLLLTQAGMGGNILLGHHPSWRQRVSQLLIINPAREWLLQDICLELRVSETSLRRRLKEEQTGFREILEDVRLATGLSLLLETNWPIGRVADAVGYQSQSRFGERFKRRFGMTPSELRFTRIEDSGEKLAVRGE